MENSGGIQASLAGRYATALFGLARDEQQIDAVTRSLDTLEAAMNESADFKTLVSSPLVNRTEAGKAVRALTPTLGVDPITGKFLGVLADNGRLSELKAVINLPEVKERMVTQGQTPVGNTPEEFTANVRADLPKWEALIKASGAKIE